MRERTNRPFINEIVMVLAAVFAFNLSACGGVGGGAASRDSGAGGSPDAAPGCVGPQCAFTVGNPVVVGQTPGGGASMSGFSVAIGSDGQTVAAGWSETGDQQIVKVSASRNGGQSFTTPIPVDLPTDVQLTAVHLQVTDGAGILAGAVAYQPDPAMATDDTAPWDSWARVYQSTDGAASFHQLADLKSATGVRSFTDGGFSASPDGTTLVWSWVDVTPADRLDPSAVPGNTVLASISSDSGHTFGAPQIISSAPFIYATRIAAFVRAGGAGVVYAQQHPITGLPTDVGFPYIAQAATSGAFAGGTQIAADDFGAVPAGLDSTVSGASPGAALDKNGNIHVAWWSAETIGLWYASSSDGASFSTPVRVFQTAQPTPANVKIAADGAGNSWIAALDGPGVRVFLIPAGGVPVEIKEAALATLGNSSRGYTVWASVNDTFDIAGLPTSGAVLMWLGGQPPAADATTPPPPQPINVRRIAP